MEEGQRRGLGGERALRPPVCSHPHLRLQLGLQLTLDLGFGPHFVERKHEDGMQGQHHARHREEAHPAGVRVGVGDCERDQNRYQRDGQPALAHPQLVLLSLLLAYLSEEGGAGSGDEGACDAQQPCRDVQNRYTGR